MSTCHTVTAPRFFKIVESVIDLTAFVKDLADGIFRLTASMIGGSLEIVKLDLRREFGLRFRIFILGKAEFLIHRHAEIFELVGGILGKYPIAVALVDLIHSQFIAVIRRQLQPIECLVRLVVLLQVIATHAVHGNVIAHIRDHFKVAKVLGTVLQLAVIIADVVERKLGRCAYT